MSIVCKGPSLYEFLTEAELQQYFNIFKNDLKVQNVGQLKFVTVEDLQGIGMSKPEIRRLKKFFHKYFPQTYLSKVKKILLPKKENGDGSFIIINDESTDKQSVRVPSKHIIPADAIIINKELGVGEFGVVQQGIWTNEEGDRIQVAIKCLSKERMQNQPMEFLKEAAIMHTIDSEHIVRLYGVVLDTDSLMLVTELAPLRSLLECIKEPSLRSSFPIITLCNFSVQICDGMSYLESKRLIHRDLAARNILVFSKNKVKISDFGLSRALGVGKDYYQTNFNVNLKLPIAWCAPECINYLRFTSASDVWAFGVTLWEMFSYGFQPWAALTGQQILEAIDEPNFQRLEQPETCPKDYYLVMMKCWQHDPNKRPKFLELINILPDCKPEQVQATTESEDINIPGGKRDKLHYGMDDIITVLDKKPLPDNASLWKGILNSGKTGLFNPSTTVAYLGTSVPSYKHPFQRGDGKNLYSSRRRLRPDMISGPQGDFKHTGHVGLDGAYFGDLSFLGEKVQSDDVFNNRSLEKYQRLPKQIVTPYKPNEDQDMTNSLTRASSDVSDRAPLLKKESFLKIGDRGKSGPAAEQNWSDSASEELASSPSFSANTDHEYHEISDEETFERAKCEMFDKKCFDLGPSLMDEVFKALGHSTTNSDPSLDFSESSSFFSTSMNNMTCEENEIHNVSNEIKELTTKICREGKKRQATVKPISATDQRTLDSAIAMANELASQSMLELDRNLESLESDIMPESPMTPSSPTKQTQSRFSFKLTSRSPKTERKNFSEAAASIPDIQASITEEVKEAYNTLIERPAYHESVHLASILERERESFNVDNSESNPLRMLRSGMAVRPKVRGNKHNVMGVNTVDRSHGIRASSKDNYLSSRFEMEGNQSLPRGFKHKKVPPPTMPKPFIKSDSFGYESQENSLLCLNAEGFSNLSIDDASANLLPLPPRDRTRTTLEPKTRHQRKHPLVIPGSTNGVAQNQDSGSFLLKPCSSPRLLIQHTHNPLLENNSPSTSVSNNRDVYSVTPVRIPPAKPPRLFANSVCSGDESFESQVANEMDALDQVHVEEDNVGCNEIGNRSSGGSLYQSSDHVSCEDLLEFALDRPNSKRTRGPSQGTQSDEVHIMQKVLKKEVSPEECLVALNECNWDIHRAIKLIRLQLFLSAQRVTLETAHSTLVSFNWDVEKAVSYLSASSEHTEDTAQV